MPKINIVEARVERKPEGEQLGKILLEGGTFFIDGTSLRSAEGVN